MIIATAVATVTLAFAGPAAAPSTLQGDLDAAAAYWQVAPAHCSTRAVSAARMPRRVLGEATVPNPVEAAPCVMKVSRGLSPRLRCLVVVHEYGHWLGLSHSHDRDNPMFPEMDPRMIVPECERA